MTAILVEDDCRIRRLLPCAQLNIDRDAATRQFYEKLKNSPAGFSGQFAMKDHPTLYYRWAAVNQTEALVLWQRRGKVVAAGLMLTGLEGANEQATMKAAMLGAGLPEVPELWEKFPTKRPLVMLLHFDIRSPGDRMLMTVAPVMAAAFFNQFGAGERVG